MGMSLMVAGCMLGAVAAVCWVRIEAARKREDVIHTSTMNSYVWIVESVRFYYGLAVTLPRTLILEKANVVGH